MRRERRHQIITRSIGAGLLIGGGLFLVQHFLADGGGESEISTAQPTGQPHAVTDEAITPSNAAVAATQQGAEEDKTPQKADATAALPSTKADASSVVQTSKDAGPIANTPPAPAPKEETNTKREPTKPPKATKATKTTKAVKPKKNASDPTPKKEKPPNKETSDGSNDPLHIDGMLARAKRIRKSKPAEALRLYKKVLSKNTKHGDAMQLGARAYLQLGQTGNAIKLLKTCRTQRPRFSPCLYYLGRAYERAGNASEARKAYRTLIDAFPESSLASKARQKLGP